MISAESFTVQGRHIWNYWEVIADISQTTMLLNAEQFNSVIYKADHVVTHS